MQYYQIFHIILLVLISLLPFGFLTTYIISVANGHVEAWFPYISDTGTFPPESCIFAQILTVGALLTLIIVYARYYHVKLILDSKELVKLKLLNKIGFFFGVISALGTTLVGSFQESNVAPVHFLGAFLAFGGQFFFHVVQTIISHKLAFVLYSNYKILRVRAAILSISFILGLLFSIFSGVSRSKFDGENPYKWLPTDGGYAEHVVSTVSEWILAILLMTCFLTFLNDYKRIKISYPVVIDPSISENDSASSPIVSDSQTYGTIE